MGIIRRFNGKNINSIENNEVIANQTKHYNMLRNKINNIFIF